MRISDWSSDVCSSDLLGLRIRRQLGPVEVEVDRVGAGHRLNHRGRRRRCRCRRRLPLEAGHRCLEAIATGRDIVRLEVLLLLLHPAVEGHLGLRSEEHTSELQSLMRNSYAVFCWKKKKLYETN